MTTNELKDLARAYFTEELNAKDTSVVPKFISADYVINMTPPGTPPGPGGEQALVAAFATAFPDFQVIVEDLVADGDRVAARWRFTGTHQGDFQGLPATGRHVDVPGMNIFQVRDGQFCRNWVSLDQLALLQQVGAIPAPALAAV